jgi:hypothetical protein
MTVNKAPNKPRVASVEAVVLPELRGSIVDYPDNIANLNVVKAILEAK